MKSWIQPVLEGLFRIGGLIGARIRARRQGPTATDVLDEHDPQAPEAVEDAREYLEEVRRGDTP